MASSKDQHNVEAELACLGELTLGELKARYVDIKGHTLPKYMRRGLIELAVGYAIQQQAFGGLDRPTQKRLDALVAQIVPNGVPKAKARPRNRRLKPGTQLIRQWRGHLYEVTVAETGFDWNGKTWGSLTEIATAITGTKWNGWVFFGIRQKRASPAVTRHV